MAFTRTPERAVRLTDAAGLEFFERETSTRKEVNRRKLTFRAPESYLAGASLILPEDNSADGALTKVGNVLSWTPGGGGGITEEELEAALADYQLLVEKGAASGYASLDGSVLVPAAQLGTGTPTSAKFLDGSRAWRVLADSDIPSTIARDTEVTAEIAAHVALSDPHTQYQKESEKDAASGYPSLDGSTLVPAAELGTGTPTSAKFLDGSRAWRVLAATDLGTNTPTSAKFLDGSQAWRVLAAGDLGSGTPTSSKFLDGSQAWRVLTDADIPDVITVTGISSPFIGVTVSSSTTTVDLSTGLNFKLALQSSTTITLSNPVDGAKYLFYCKQDATGNRAVTWPANVYWRSSIEPVITPVPNGIDVVTMIYHGSDNIYLAEYAQIYGAA